MLVGKYTGLFIGESFEKLDYNNPFVYPSEKWINLSIVRLIEMTDDSDIIEKLEELKVGLIKMIEIRIASCGYKDKDILVRYLNDNVFFCITTKVESIITNFPIESKKRAPFIELENDFERYLDEVNYYINN